MAHAGVVLASMAVVTFGCAGSAPPPAASADARGEPPNGTFQGTRWGTFHSKRFEMSIGLPDGAAWKIDDHRSGWLRAEHPGTRSTFALRFWSEADNVTRKGCYARAREWDPELPDLEAQALIDDRMRPWLGFRDARVAVGVAVRPGSAPATGGFVVAIVGDVRRCALAAFRTEAEGAAAQDEVADRLVVVSDRVLPSMKLDQSFTPSREPARPLPGASGGPGGGL